MNKNVLIVDDDQEFTALLRGIFEQAGYTVHSAFDAEQGLSTLKKKVVDLVILDQRLPGGISGTDLMHKLKEMNNQIPVIMVSGFLNDDAIRDLIRNGVQGVFIKPLNIFSLLKKASEILDSQSKSKSKDQSDSSSGEGARPRGAIGKIKGLSDKGERFIKSAHEASGFRRNLLLIGPPGTKFEEIGCDIIRLSGNDERTFTLEPGSVSADVLNKPFTGEDSDKPISFIVLDAENLSVDEADRLITFVDEKGGSASSLRTIFCLSQTVEELYDNEKIDEELYLFLGTNELKVPALKDMPEDLIEIAKSEIQAQSADTNIDMKLRTFLLDYDWPENMLELQSVIIRAIHIAQPLSPQLKHFKAALNPNASSGDPVEEVDHRSSLERFLSSERVKYEGALKILNIS